MGLFGWGSRDGGVWPGGRPCVRLEAWIALAHVLLGKRGRPAPVPRPPSSCRGRQGPAVELPCGQREWKSGRQREWKVQTLRICSRIRLVNESNTKCRSCRPVCQCTDQAILCSRARLARPRRHDRADPANLHGGFEGPEDPDGRLGI